MNTSCFLYVSAALLNALLTATNKPADEWEWFRYITGAVVAAVLSWKTYLSTPPPAGTEKEEAPPPRL